MEDKTALEFEIQKVWVDLDATKTQVCRLYSVDGRSPLTSSTQLAHIEAQKSELDSTVLDQFAELDGLRQHKVQADSDKEETNRLVSSS